MILEIATTALELAGGDLFPLAELAEGEMLLPDMELNQSLEALNPTDGDLAIEGMHFTGEAEFPLDELSQNEEILSDRELNQPLDECLEINDSDKCITEEGDLSAEKYWQSEQTVNNYDFDRNRAIYQDDLKLGEPHDSGVLRHNLEIATGNNPENASAHHLVGNETPIAAQKLEQYGIDRNDPTNGIFLPNKVESDCEGVLHTGRHAQTYYNEVERRFLNVNSREDVIDALQSLKDDLYSGKLELQNSTTN